MKNIILYLAAFLWAVSPALLFCSPTTTAMLAVLARKNAGGAPAPTYLLEENFEATGYDLGTAPVWYLQEQLNPDFDATAIPGSDNMTGTYCLEMDNASGTEFINGYQALTTTGYLEGYFQYLYTGTGASTIHEIFWVVSDFDAQGKISIFNNQLYPKHGTTQTLDSGHVLTANQLYHIWWEYHEDPGGSTGTMDVWTSTTTTKPGTGSSHSQAVGAGDTVNGVKAVATDTGGNKAYYDNIRVDDATIGSSPP